MDVRRVVTGHDAEGKSVFVTDEMVAPITLDLLPGNDLHRLWAADVKPNFPDNGAMPNAESYFPPLDGVRFEFFTIPPNAKGAASASDREALRAEFEQKVPGLA